jgi:RNA polymerase sigma factor (sigma-70 family)
MGARGAADRVSDAVSDDRVDVEALMAIVRRIIRARVDDPAMVEDLTQETLVRVLAKANRIAPAMLEPYTIVTARNVVRSLWTERDRQRRNQHRALDLDGGDAPDEQLLKNVDAEAVSKALTRLSERERATLLAHEVAGRDTKSLATELESTPGAVAAQLNRTRARLRVEYLLALHRLEPTSNRCRPVLLSLSAADRRRQGEVGAARHLLECAVCATLSGPLLERGQPRDDEIRVKISTDSDVVEARKGARDLAARLGFSRTETTVIATAVSEISRNIVKFAERGEVFLELLDEPRPGLRVVARDLGPGIADVDQALRDGYSTYSGLGLGLPGARRLMDEFDLVSEPGRGTTITMTKWRREG